MKIKLVLMAALLASFFISAASAATTTTGFGVLPGAAPNAYSGSGIPQNTSVWEQVTDLPDNDSLTLGMAITQYKTNPSPGNDSVSTYYVEPGLGNTPNPRTPWNFDF
jgi:hypothetical protein